MSMWAQKEIMSLAGNFSEISERQIENRRGSRSYANC